MCADLAREVRRGGSVVDEHLQDQLVVFQALAEGRTSFPRPDFVGEEERGGDLLEPAMERLGIIGEGEEEEERGAGQGGREDDDGEKRHQEVRVRRVKKTYEPFGEGSTHTRTARWVASELLPAVRWFNEGSVCEGVGLSFDK